MGGCAALLNEEGILDYIATKIGIMVLSRGRDRVNVGLFQMCIPKFELEREEGEGKLQCSVCHCISEQIITVQRIRKFPQHARQYLMAYYHAIDSGQASWLTNRLNKAIPNMALWH